MSKLTHEQVEAIYQKIASVDEAVTRSIENSDAPIFRANSIISAVIKGLKGDNSNVKKIVSKLRDVQEMINDVGHQLTAAIRIGPRGGKIIGETSTGKPIYEKADHSGHKGFSGKDHQEAYAAHSVLGERARHNGDTKAAIHHGQQQAIHRSKMEAAETLGEELHDFEDAHANVKIAPHALERHPVSR